MYHIVREARSGRDRSIVEVLSSHHYWIVAYFWKCIAYHLFECIPSFYVWKVRSDAALEIMLDRLNRSNSNLLRVYITNTLDGGQTVVYEWDDLYENVCWERDGF
tara:strand:- start:586 stop:900 length:315 start_codon:yes stop_codon:yes gene_type:complete